MIKKSTWENHILNVGKYYTRLTFVFELLFLSYMNYNLSGLYQNICNSEFNSYAQIFTFLRM